MLLINPLLHGKGTTIQLVHSCETPKALVKMTVLHNPGRAGHST